MTIPNQNKKHGKVWALRWRQEFFFVLSRAWDKKEILILGEIAPQPLTFGFHGPMFNHWATEKKKWSDVQYYNQAGPNTYAFLVAIKSGHVMSHPKLPKPESISEDPNSVNIFELEPGKEFRRLFDEVKETGQPRWVANYSQFDDFHPLPVNQ